MRIQGINIPEDKRLEIGLTALFGVGRARAQMVLNQVGVSHGARPKDLNTEQANSIRKIIEEGFKVEGELKREISGNIKRLKDIKAYRGTRHARRLPVRGQRTKTNSRTVRGNVRKTMGSGKRKVEKK
jgi:small subunit ribosomal protein S13